MILSLYRAKSRQNAEQRAKRSARQRLRTSMSERGTTTEATHGSCRPKLVSEGLDQ